MKVFSSVKRMSAAACILLISYPAYSMSAKSEMTPADTIPHSRDLNEVIVEGSGGKKRDKIGHLSISGAEINRRPALLGEHDVIKALQSSSGVVSGTEGFAGLYVRGGETDQNLYLIDGLPLLNVYHFGGLFSTFNTNSVDGVEFYKGAFPSIFAERASSIVDVAIKQPDLNKTYGSVSIGLVSGQFYLSTPLKKGCSALSVALRRTWFDVFTFPALSIINATKKQDGSKNIFHYNFTDLSVKLSAKPGERTDLSLLLFYGKDNFKLGEERFDPDFSKNILQKNLNKMSWGNWGIAFNYKLTTHAGTLKIEPYISKAFSMDSQENMNDRDGHAGLTAITEVRPSVLQIGIRESFRFPVTRSLYGTAGMQQTWYDYNVGNPSSFFNGISSTNAQPRFENHSPNGLLSAFGELDCNIANTIQGSIGIRGARYLSKEMRHWIIEPRLSVRLNLPFRSGISVSYSRVAQYAQQVSSNYMFLPSDAWLPTASRQKPLLCDIYSFGFFKNLKNGFNIKAEAWWKNMGNIAEYKPNTSVTTSTIPWYEKITFGKGWAYGLDFEAEGRLKKITWEIAYGLMWNWRKFPDINSGKRYPAKFDNRHKLDINLGWTINDRLELTGQWEYMTGNRTTLALYNIASPDIAFPDAPFGNPLSPDGSAQGGVDYFENRNNVRIPSFHRLNLNLSLKGRINDRLSYKWEFGLYNAYCRMNPFTVVKDYINSEWSDNGDYRKFKTLSLLPILPSVSYTLNF